jgi:hypothetical protein
LLVIAAVENKCFLLGLCVSARACEYVHVALLIQHTTRMSFVVTSSVAPLSQPHFSELSQTMQFSEKFLKHKISVLISLQLLSNTFPIL